jgi:hypothetical protein
MKIRVTTASCQMSNLHSSTRKLRGGDSTYTAIRILLERLEASKANFLLFTLPIRTNLAITFLV